MYPRVVVTELLALLTIEADREKIENGCDSDGEVGPFYDAVADEELVPDMALMTVEDEAAHRETEVTRATAIRAGVDDESRP